MDRRTFLALLAAPAVAQLIAAGLIREDALTANGKSIGENCRGVRIADERVIRPFGQPLVEDAGFLVLTGNLFDSAIMKTSVIGADFRARYLSNPSDPEAFEGPVVVFDGPEDYHARIDDPALGIDVNTLLVMRGAGPVGYPGAAEVVNMRAPGYLLREGVRNLPCIGDGRQSGTSGSPSILNASPEAAVNGGLALLRTGDRVRIDLRAGTADVLIDEAELAARRAALLQRLDHPRPRARSPLAHLAWIHPLLCLHAPRALLHAALGSPAHACPRKPIHRREFPDPVKSLPSTED